MRCAEEVVNGFSNILETATVNYIRTLESLSIFNEPIVCFLKVNNWNV